MLVVSIDGEGLPDLQTSDRLDCRVRRYERFSVRDPDERRLQGCARRLFSCSNTRGHCGRRFTRERYVDVVDAEYGKRPLRMPPNCDGGSKLIAVLNIGPDVGTYVVATSEKMPYPSPCGVSN
jgi:hypothetical protein